MRLAFFICASKAFGERVICARRGLRTKLHPQLGCQAYRCRSASEFEDLQDVVQRGRRALWCAVRVEHGDGALAGVPEAWLEQLPETVPISSGDHLPQGPSEGAEAHTLGEAGSTPAPATTPEPPAAPPADLAETIRQFVSARPRKLADVAASLNVTAAEIKAAVADAPPLKLKQGGWVGVV